MHAGPLTGFTIGVPDWADADELTGLVGRLGGEVVAASVRDVTTMLLDRRLDALVFSAPIDVELTAEAVERLDEDDVRRALAEVVLVALDDETAEALVDLELPRPIRPRRPATGDAVRLLATVLSARSEVLLLGGVEVRVQGHAVITVDDGEVITLSAKERAVLDALAARPGAVRSKRQILGEVWQPGTDDPHVVEVTVARLRQRLGRAGRGIETVIRRGYRLTAG